MVDDLNQIIDGVAKEMTSAPVDASLARRVGARMADGGVPRAAVWMRPVLLAPIAAACVIAVAVFIARDRRVIAPPPSVAPIVAVAPEPATHVEPVARAQPSRTARTASRRRGVAPLLVVRDMTVTPIVVDRVDIAPMVRAEQIEIDPIAITRIEIPPMP